MPPTLCMHCEKGRAVVKRPKNHQKLCQSCFIVVFEDEIHQTIVESQLFHPGEKVAIGASGGKDSTVLASVLKTLNERHNYGLDLVLLSVDEGIKGYRDDSLETVKRNAIQYEMPLHIVGYDQLFGWTMDQVVETIGKKGNCTYCGVFRRQALDKGANFLKIKHIVTGHNADDVAETVLMNFFRGDWRRLSRTASIVTGCDASDVKRSKPLKCAYEKEIVLYAHHKKLDYFSTECIYSPEAFRGMARSLIKDLEKADPESILNIVRSGEDIAKITPDKAVDMFNHGNGLREIQMQKAQAARKGEEQAGSAAQAQTSYQDLETDLTSSSGMGGNDVVKLPVRQRQKNRTPKASRPLGRCTKCRYMSSHELCQACNLLEKLNKNKADITL